jgi:hypothetical protein
MGDNSMRCLLAVRPWQRDDAPELSMGRLPVAHRFHQVVEELTLNRVVFRHGSFALWPGLEGAQQGLLTFLMQREARLDLEFLLDGVVVERFRFPLGVKGSLKTAISRQYGQVGLRVWVGLERQQVDLSHFKVREGEQQVARVVETVWPVMLDTAQRLQSHLSQLHYLWMEERHALTWGLALTAMAGVVTAASGNPWVGAWVVGGNALVAPLNFAFSQGLVRGALREVEALLQAGPAATVLA